MKIRFFIFLLLLFSLKSIAFSQIGFYGVGGSVSLNNPEVDRKDSGYQWDPGFGPGIGLILYLGEIIPNLALKPEFNYWQAKDEEDVNNYSYEYKVSDIQINCSFHYYFEGQVQGFFAGGGLGYNFIKYSGSINPPVGQKYSFESKEEEVGLYFDGGYQFPISNVSAFIMGRYSFIHHLDTFSILFGIVYKIN